jgi:hypothetical protein
MREIVIATPLNANAASQPYDFMDGISIRDLSGKIDWDGSIIKRTVSEHDYEHLTGMRYWLCVTGEQTADDEQLYSKAHRAAMAMQLVLPIGAMHLFLKLEHSALTYDNTGSSHPRHLCSTLLGRIANLEAQNPAGSFDAIYKGVSRAFAEKLIRLQNPILLLEHGMQACHVPLSTLMFVIGLDMLFMAGSIGPFVRRIGGFVGPHHLIFPPDAMERQPNTKAVDVLEDLYTFRNKIGHGHEIPQKPFRQPHDLTSTTMEKINFDVHSYAELMMQSGLFILAGTLRRIFTEGMMDEVKDRSRWRQRMRDAEQRYCNEGGREPRRSEGY